MRQELFERKIQQFGEKRCWIVCNEIETDNCYTLTNAPDAEPKEMTKKLFRSASLCD